MQSENLSIEEIKDFVSRITTGTPVVPNEDDQNTSTVADLRDQSKTKDEKIKELKKVIEAKETSLLNANSKLAEYKNDLELKIQVNNLDSLNRNI